MSEYYPYSFMSKRLYNKVFSDVVKIPDELSDGTISQYQYWGFIDIGKFPEWVLIRLEESEKIAFAIIHQQVKAMIFKQSMCFLEG